MVNARRTKEDVQFQLAVKCAGCKLVHSLSPTFKACYRPMIATGDTSMPTLSSTQTALTRCIPAREKQSYNIAVSPRRPMFVDVLEQEHELRVESPPREHEKRVEPSSQERNMPFCAKVRLQCYQVPSAPMPAYCPVPFCRILQSFPYSFFRSTF